MAHIIWSNNANSTLAGALTNVATTAQLAAGTGALFPQPTGDQYFKLTFTDSATGSQREIVHCTNVTGDTLTIVRAQEGTSARPWLAGDFADHMITAGGLESYVEIVDLPSFPLSVPNGGTGQVSFTSGAVLLGNGTSPLSEISTLNVGRGGTGQAALTGNAVLIGNGTTGILAAAPSGTLPLVGTGGTPAFGQLSINASSAGGSSVNLIGALPVANAPVNIIAIYPTPGVYTFNVPANLYWIFAQVTGGGGGGAGSNSLGPYAGGGGGSGGYTEGWFAVVPAQAISVTVGAAGAFGVAGAGGSDGGAGGTSSFGAFATATGGAGGQSVANVAGGVPGLGSGGVMSSPGGYGLDGNITGDATGGGAGGPSYWGGGVRQAAGGAPANTAAFGAGGGGGYAAGNGSIGMTGLVVIRG